MVLDICFENSKNYLDLILKTCYGGQDEKEG